MQQRPRIARAKAQVLANLANFAYDPLNYDFLRRLNVIDLFLDTIEDPIDLEMQEFAILGLCNLCPDPANKASIIQNQGVPHIIKCLSSTNEDVVMGAITTLYYLTDSSTQSITMTKPVLGALRAYSKAPSKRLSTLAKVVLKHHGDDVRAKLVSTTTPTTSTLEGTPAHTSTSSSTSTPTSSTSEQSIPHKQPHVSAQVTPPPHPGAMPHPPAPYPYPYPPMYPPPLVPRSAPAFLPYQPSPPPYMAPGHPPYPPPYPPPPGWQPPPHNFEEPPPPGSI
eukprot:TRINITY_DN14491_c0_g1_i2.p1 TRINITY_DN14491_c0_g1~~TRINITY_DN14491_c0_g1_i2.p1  ORF type:complete len:280 (-),score=56.28 TRINITY_DN14491_c0_g1_i2:44-883(-)